MIPMPPAIKAGWSLIRPFLPYILAGLALLLAWKWADSRGYDRGYAEAEEAYQAAVLEASSKFMDELRARDQAIADAQGQVVEVVKWRTRVQTIYEEAAKNDPDCMAWAAGRVACPLGLSETGKDRHGLPADP